MIDRDTSSMNMVRYYQQYNTVYIGILLWGSDSRLHTCGAYVCYTTYLLITKQIPTYNC